MSNDRIFNIVLLVIIIGLFIIDCYKSEPPKDLHPLQQKVSVDSAKYIEVGKRMDNQIKKAP